MDVEWRPIKGFEGLYEVSDHGQVRSLDRVVVDKNGTRKRMFHGKLLNNICANTGYHHVSLHRNNKRITRRQVQRLVAEAFLGEGDVGFYVDHIDGNKLNNHISNLRWVHPAVNNNNTPYTRYLRSLLIQNNITHMCEEEFYKHGS